MVMLLDTTLRDGSYAIDFGFSRTQTAEIVAALSSVGVPLIEVGHGIGLGASRVPEQKARESDETYMKAAADSCGGSKWGMFVIPGIANLNDLDLLLDHNPGFVRIGVAVDALPSGQPFIDRCRSRGVFVCVNLMKSYSRPAIEFGKVAREAIERGAEVVYVVDSAGSMNPKQLREYFEELDGLPFGFHAHNNLGLANANTLEAFLCNATVLDCSLQGLGRSSGNAVTEQIVAILQQSGSDLEINLLELIDQSERLVRPLLPRNGVDGLDLVSGFGGFHTSYMGAIRYWSSIHNVDPRIMIIELCKVTQTDAPDELLDSIGKRCVEAGLAGWRGNRAVLSQYFGNEQRDM